MSLIPDNRVCSECGDYIVDGLGLRMAHNLSSRCRCDEPRDCPKCGTELDETGCGLGCDPNDTLLTVCRGDPLLRKDAA